MHLSNGLLMRVSGYRVIRGLLFNRVFNMLCKIIYSFDLYTTYSFNIHFINIYDINVSYQAQF